MPNCRAVLLALLAASCLPPTALAHVGGVPTRPRYSTPIGPLGPDRDHFTVAWVDGDADPTGVFHFAAREGSPPPFAAPAEAFGEGTPLAEIAIDGGANEFEVAAAELPTGAWSVVARTVDPPLCTLITAAPGLLIVRHGDDPLPLGGLATHPSGLGAAADEGIDLRFRAVSATPPRLSVSAGIGSLAASDPEDHPCRATRLAFDERHTIATDTPMAADAAAGQGFWEATVPWDTTAVDGDVWIIRFRLEDDDGRRYEGFASAPVTVYHPPTRPTRDAGGADAADTPAAPVDTAPDEAGAMVDEGVVAARDGAASDPSTDVPGDEATDAPGDDVTPPPQGGGCTGAPAPLWLAWWALCWRRRRA